MNQSWHGTLISKQIQNSICTGQLIKHTTKTQLFNRKLLYKDQQADSKQCALSVTFDATNNCFSITASTIETQQLT